MSTKARRSTMPPISETMRSWAFGLCAEVQNWPQVTVKHAFGMTLVYRSGIVFAALSQTRSLYAEDAILLKFASQPPKLVQRIAAEPRFSAGTMQSRRGNGEEGKWRLFLMRSDGDVHGAVERLAEAYGRAKPGRP